jgi:Na+/phosphate symporter
VLASVLIVRTQLRYRRQPHKKYTDDEILIEKEETGKRIEKRSRQVVQTIISANKILSFALDGLLREDPVLLEEALVMNDELNRKTKKQKNKIIRFISEMKSVDYDSGHFYIQVSDYQREVAHSLSCLIDQMRGYLKNRQTSATDFLNNELKHLVNDSDEFFNLALHIVKEDKFDEIGELVEKENSIADILRDIETDEINRIKNRVVNSTGSLSFFQGLSEIKNLFHHSVSLIKSHRDFIVANSKTT